MSNQKIQGGFRMKQTHQFLQTDSSTPQATQYQSYIPTKDNIYMMGSTQKPADPKPTGSSLQGLAIRSNISAQADYM